MPVYERKGSGEKPRRFYVKLQINKKQVRLPGTFQSRLAALKAEDAALVQQTMLMSGCGFATMAAKRLEELKAYSTPLWFANCRGILESYADWYNLSVCEITQEAVQAKILAIAKEKGNSVANRHLVILKSCFSLAVRMGKLNRNPVIGIKKLPTEAARKYIPPRQDIEAILALAEPLDRAYLLTVWLTAARVREINNLTWADVDFERRRVCLWTRKKRGGNRRSRWVSMTQRVLESLQYAYGCRALNSPWVFTNREQVRRYPAEIDKWRYDYRDKFLDTLCRKAGVQPFTYHALRHQTASALDDAGVPLAVIQSILGHEQATTTSIYLHALGRVHDMEVLDHGQWQNPASQEGNL